MRVVPYQKTNKMLQKLFYVDVVEATPLEEKEMVYSEAEDGIPKPIPVAEFARYFKNKSSNGAIVLLEEFRVPNNSPIIMCM